MTNSNLRHLYSKIKKNTWYSKIKKGILFFQPKYDYHLFHRFQPKYDKAKMALTKCTIKSLNGNTFVLCKDKIDIHIIEKLLKNRKKLKNLHIN